ncbi:MAG: VanZ family protein [Bacillus sp. (in: Bacteria)]|nr:VanZ family protein [Bacillus sp. (in: firmicutes)]MCM1427675.1 VanZ family protein [Eubacterium sp.]
MDEKKKRNLWLELAVIFVSIIGLMLLVYLVVVLSFQKGEQSISETMDMSARIARYISDEPTDGEIRTINHMLRFAAHLGLFFAVGMVTTFVSMVIFRRYYRILGVLASGVLCYMLAYYTEYYKQFVEGRHYEEIDVTLNKYGSLLGIGCMVVSYFLNRLLVKLSS